jgi:LysM repeat protein
MPAITLSVPLAIGLLALFLTIGALMVFLALRSKPETIIPATPTLTATITVTPSLTPTELPPTVTDTPIPTPTPLSYTVVTNDTCLGIAATFKVSIQSIILLNNLSADCLLSVGDVLLIPQPTPTVTPLPTSTLSAAEATEQACEKINYEVQENDTLSSIALDYGISMAAIREENGLPGDTVFLGQTLVIPLCKRPTPLGPTPTATMPPPYPAPNLLLPADGSPFTLADQTITLQWASVGTLRENESYQVTVEDVTEGQGRKMVDYVTDTKFIVPSTFRPGDRNPHVYRWWVTTVRKIGTDADGNPVWESAGALSVVRTFIWIGVPGEITPTP